MNLAPYAQRRPVKRTEAKTLTTVSFFLVLFSAAIFLPGVGIMERTILGDRLALECGLGGAILLGIPLCWVFRHRKFYGEAFPTERYLAWLFLLCIAAINSINVGVLLNAFGGTQTEKTITAATLGFERSAKHHSYFLLFKAPGGHRQQIEMKTAEEYHQYEKEDFIDLKTHSGFLGFPVIQEYAPAAPGKVKIK